MNNLIYEHLPQVHRTQDAAVVLPLLVKQFRPRSVVDFGAGLGTWLAVFEQLGVSDYIGIEHPEVDLAHYAADRAKLLRQSLSDQIELGRRFDLAVCIEVAEHLREMDADHLVEAITRHSDRVLWSAAIPGQKGINHFNEQYPDYWQAKFRARGYYFHDNLRGDLQDQNIFPCYKNNMFLVDRDPQNEWKGKDWILPAFWQAKLDAHARELENIERGSKSVSWYLGIGVKGLLSKLKRRVRRT
jgi:hypothetical protein